MRLAFLVPGSLAQLTGGYLYDRHVMDGLRARGQAVDVIELPGRYPDADADTRAAAGAALVHLPDDCTVIVDGLALPGLANDLATQASRLRLVGFIHHPLSLETGLAAADAARYARLEAELWPHLHGAICPSAHTARAVVASGLPAEHVAVVAPGTARPTLPQRPPKKQGPMRLLTVGTVTPRKGHLLLIEALVELRHLDWRLDCIGSLLRDPVAAQALQARIAALGLADRIHLHGEQAETELSQAYRQADLFVLPSYHEGYGMVFAEALAHGLPIIATTAGAIPDTVPIDASLLVPAGDLSALTQALAQALGDATLRARLAAAAQQAGQALPDWHQAVANWLAALHQVTQAKR